MLFAQERAHTYAKIQTNSI